MIGLSSYAYFWHGFPSNPDRWSIEQMLSDAAVHGAEVFQICDDRRIEEYDDASLHKLRDLASDLGLVLELGTRGVRQAHLRKYLRIATALGAPLLRSMIQPLETPLAEAAPEISSVLHDFSAAGVKLGLETYELISSEQLVALVERVDHSSLGVVLDPGNCVAGLEHPRVVVEKTAHHVLNLHVKDFAFARQEGWVGFVFTGARLGEGLLDYDHLIRTVSPVERGMSQIIEHWLPWQGEISRTLSVEQEWIRHHMDYLRSYPA